MTLLTAHRILIGAAAAFFVFYGVWEMRGLRSGVPGSLWHGLLAFLGALAFLIYYRTIPGRGGRTPGDSR